MWNDKIIPLSSHQHQSWMTALCINNFFNIATKKKKKSFHPWKSVGGSSECNGWWRWSRNPYRRCTVGRGFRDKPQKPSGPLYNQGFRKQQWNGLYHQKSNDEFVEKVEITRITFNLLVNTLLNEFVFTLTNFVPEPISPDREMAVALYRLAHGVTYIVLEDVFGISLKSGCTFFNKSIRHIVVACFCDECVKFPERRMKSGKQKCVDS